MLAEHFTREGFPTEVVSPDQLEYRAGVLRKGDFAIDIVYRRIKLQEFLVRFDLSHPLMRAYKDHAVCMVNSFRSEMGAKRQSSICSQMRRSRPVSGDRAPRDQGIRAVDPVVQAAKTTYQGRTVDLPEFVMKHRAKLVLKPNDDSADLNSLRGADTDDIGVGKSAAPGHADPLCGAGACRAGPRRFSADTVREPDDEGNAGGSPSAFFPRQSARLLELADRVGIEHVLDAHRPRAHVLARSEVSRRTEAQACGAFSARC